MDVGPQSIDTATVADVVTPTNDAAHQSPAPSKSEKGPSRLLIPSLGVGQEQGQGRSVQWATEADHQLSNLH